MYNAAVRELGRAPKNEQELKDFVAAKGDPFLKPLDLESPDQLFVSERDGEPFVIVYGQPPKGMRGDLVAYEQTGVDGKRRVGYSLGIIEEVGEEDLREMAPEGS